ncbi:MAG: hypothetical protein V4496_03905 [Pseudomonadota bacterium]
MLFIVEEQNQNSSFEINSSALTQKNILTQALHRNSDLYPVYIQEFCKACWKSKIRANLFLEKHPEILKNLEFSVLKKLLQDLPVVMKFMQQLYFRKENLSLEDAEEAPRESFDDLSSITNDDEANKKLQHHKEQFRILLEKYWQEYQQSFTIAREKHAQRFVEEQLKIFSAQGQAEINTAAITESLQKSSQEFPGIWQEFPRIAINNEIIEVLDLEILIIGFEFLIIKINRNALLAFFESFMEQRPQSHLNIELNIFNNIIDAKKDAINEIINIILICLTDNKSNSPETYLNLNSYQLFFSDYVHAAPFNSVIEKFNYLPAIKDERLINIYTDIFLSTQASLSFFEHFELMQVDSSPFFKENKRLLLYFLGNLQDDDLALIINEHKQKLKLALWLMHCKFSVSEIHAALPERIAKNNAFSALLAIFFQFFDALEKLYAYIEKDPDYHSSKNPITHDIFLPLFYRVYATCPPDIVYIKTNDVSVQLAILNENYYLNKVNREPAILNAWMKNICCNGSEEQIEEFLKKAGCASIVFDYLAGTPTLSEELPCQITFFARLENNQRWNQVYMTGALLKKWRVFIQENLTVINITYGLMNGYSRLVESEIYNQKIVAYASLLNQLNTIAQQSKQAYTYETLNKLFESLCQSGLDLETFNQIKEVLQKHHNILFFALFQLIAKHKEKFGIMNSLNIPIDFSFNQIPEFAMLSSFIAECYIAQDPEHIPIDFLKTLLRTYGKEFTVVVERYSLKSRLECDTEINQTFKQAEKKEISWTQKVEDISETIQLLSNKLFEFIEKLSLRNDESSISTSYEKIKAFYFQLLALIERNKDIVIADNAPELSIISRSHNSPFNEDVSYLILTQWLFEFLFDENKYLDEKKENYLNIAKSYIENNDPKAKTLFLYLSKIKRMLFTSKDMEIIEKKFGEPIAKKIKSLHFYKEWGEISSLSLTEQRNSRINNFIEDNIAFIRENVDATDLISCFMNETVKHEAVVVSEFVAEELSKYLNKMHLTPRTNPEKSYRQLTRLLVERYETSTGTNAQLINASPNTIAAVIFDLQKQCRKIRGFFGENKLIALHDLIYRLKLYAYTHKNMHADLSPSEKEAIFGNTGIIRNWAFSKAMHTDKSNSLIQWLEKQFGINIEESNNHKTVISQCRFISPSTTLTLYNGFFKNDSLAASKDNETAKLTLSLEMVSIKSPALPAGRN